MGRITKLEITANGLLDCIEKVVNKWNPPILKNELAYSSDLAEFLRATLPTDAQIEREYRAHGTTADLWISYKGLMLKSEIFFEVKRNLKKKSDYDRLVGQIQGLIPEKNKVIVVLVGDTDVKFLDRLKEQFAKYMENSWDYAEFKIIAK
jgi:hypothetical protein